ncbi:MAG TPA: hydroxysqualene dehydroxylase HpnE [Burkholderiaceae bacterium]
MPEANGRIAIVGGGWAGMAAAVTLAAAGRPVTVFEAAKVLGGRARRVEVDGRTLDNGQHILAGAYGHTLSLLRTVHGERAEGELLERRRLHLEQPGVFRLKAPPLPAPWHLALALLSMRGLPRPDRQASVAFARRLRRSRFRCPPQLSVSALLSDQPALAVRLLWEPLCISALNTPIESASAQIFLNVLRMAFAGAARNSDLLLPRVDLTALFPAPAATYVAARAGAIRLGVTVTGVRPLESAVNVATEAGEARFEAAIVAVAPHQLTRLSGLSESRPAALAQAQVAAFAYEPIRTTYLQYGRALALAHPMLKLDGEPGQWVFDRGQLGGAPGLAAVVISTDVAAAPSERDALERAIDAQLRRLIPGLPQPAWSQTIAERRATYACVPGLSRPAPGALDRHVYLAGDYTDHEFPATVEAATRSGVVAARQLLACR